MKKWKIPLSKSEQQEMVPEALAILKHFEFERLPVESTFFRSTYRSEREFSEGISIGTAMIGMYCNNPLSVSCFHRLPYDEIWHVYGGDPFELILLKNDGSSQKILMGCNLLRGEKVQFVVPAETWQAGSLIPGGRYALFGCTMAPGFSAKGFEAALAGSLIGQYPDRAKDILRLSVNGNQTRMPEEIS